MDPGRGGIAGDCGRRVTSTRLAAELQGTLTGLQHCWTYSPELWEEARRGGVAEADQRVIKDGPEAIHGTSDESDASNLLIHEKS